MAERVTVEQNGERFTLEVPDGTSDEQIQSFLAQQQGGGKVGGDLTTPPANPTENVAAYGQQVGTKVAQDYLTKTGGGVTGEIGRIGKILYNNVTPEVVGEVLAHPMKYTQEGIKAVAAGLPGSNMSMAQAVPAAGRSIVGALTAPENLMTLPYNMAAYEQAKIRANPNAPQYANNPYAMVQRGQAPTQNIAGAMNQRAAVQNFATAGNPMPGTPQFAQLQAQQDAQAQQAIANPTASNFIERMKYYAKKYSPVMGQ